MKQEIIEKTYELIDEIKSNQAYNRLLELKEIIEKDGSLQALIKEFQIAKARYENVIKYGKYHPDFKHAQHTFAFAKERLYTNEIIQEYKGLEKGLQKVLDRVSREIAQSISPRIKHPNELGLINKH